MRLAVCMPQVPFERGGTEIFADGLVQALGERGHETALVTVPYKWYPGEQVLTQAFLWRMLDLEEANGRPIDAVIATKFPSYAVRHPRKVVWLLHQFRQAWDLDRTELGQFSESAEDRALRRKVLEFDRVALGEARKIFTTSSIVAGRLRDSTGLDAEVLAPPPAPLAFHCDAYEDFILSVNRLDRAKRIDLLIEAAAQSSGLRIVIAGDGPDRERLEQLARDRGLDGRATFTGRVSDEELADLYARCLGVYYAPVNEDYGLVPYEAFLSEKPVVTTTDAGGPLDIVHDRETGLVVAPTVEELARACVWLRDHADEARTLGPCGARHRACGDLGLVYRPAARGGRVKVSYFSPLPPSTSGIADYSALLLSALERLIEVEVVRPGRTRPIADADVALYHVGNDPDAHAWVVDALRRRPGVVVLHDFVIHHLVAGMTIGRHDGHAYLAAMEREAGAAGRMLGWGVLEGRVPPLWEIRPTEFPLAAEVLDRATGVIVHSRYVETQAREHGYDGLLWRIPHPAWPPPDIEPAQIEGAPLFGCFGHLNESKRIPQLLRAFADFRAEHPAARLLLVGAEAPGFDLAGRLERLELDSEGLIREQYVEEERLWALMSACDACVLLRAPTMGETSGSAIRTLSLGKPLVVSDVGWFAELPDDVALKVPVGEGEVEGLVTAMRRLAEPGVAARMGEAARTYVRSEHDLDRVAEEYVAALEQAAGLGVVEAKILRAVAEAAADTGVEPARIAPELAALGLVTRNGRVVQRRGLAPLRVARPLTWLGGLYALAVVVQLALGLRVVSPWIMVDELVYSDMARSFADTGHFLIRGVHANYGFVYPLLLSPAYKLFGSMIDVYLWARVINALAMCSVVFPTYLLARRVVRPGFALGAAALAVALPSTIYIGTLMTENAFYPVFMWLAYLLVRALEQPTARRQVAVLALCAIAFLTRAQAVAVVAAVLTAPLALAWIERGRPRRLAAWKTTYAIAVAAALLVVVVEVARGRSPAQVLGGYSVTTTNASYAVWPALRWILYHVAALDLSLFVLPFAALIVLAANARHLDGALRAFCAAAVTLTVWLTIEVGIFASHWSQRIEERNLFYVAPLFVIALFAWIERGQPRPSRAIVAAAGVAAALPGAIPFLAVMNINAQSDTPFLQPWWYLGDRVAGRDNVALLGVLVAVALAAAFLWLPRRYAPALPAVVALGFLLTWIPLQLWVHSFPRLSAAAYSTGITAPRAWVDAAVGRNADVTLVYTGDNPYRGWENEFWNRSIRRVYDLGTSTLLAGPTEPHLTVLQSTGLLRDPTGSPVRVRYVLADPTAQIVGERVAEDANKQMAVYRVDGLMRTSTSISGWYGDTWTGPRVDWTRHACTRGLLNVPVHSNPQLFAGVTQRIAVSGSTIPFVVRLPSTATKTIVVHLLPRAGTCHIRFDITPARKPANDPRTLGILATGFEYVPAAG